MKLINNALATLATIVLLNDYAPAQDINGIAAVVKSAENISLSADARPYSAKYEADVAGFSVGEIGYFAIKKYSGLDTSIEKVVDARAIIHKWILVNINVGMRTYINKRGQPVKMYLYEWDEADKTAQEDKSKKEMSQADATESVKEFGKFGEKISRLTYVFFHHDSLYAWSSKSGRCTIDANTKDPLSALLAMENSTYSKDTVLNVDMVIDTLYHLRTPVTENSNKKKKIFANFRVGKNKETILHPVDYMTIYINREGILMKTDALLYGSMPLSAQNMDEKDDDPENKK